MRFEFEVGQHRVCFKFNKFWGNVSVVVDGKVKLRDFRMYSKDLVVSWDVPVGAAGKHRVRIEKIRPLLFAGLRPNTYKVYVDGVFFKEYTG